MPNPLNLDIVLTNPTSSLYTYTHSILNRFSISIFLTFFRLCPFSRTFQNFIILRFGMDYEFRLKLYARAIDCHTSSHASTFTAHLDTMKMENT